MALASTSPQWAQACLFFGSRRPRWQAAIAMAVMALTDVYLTKFVYGYPFHISGYLVTWAWWGAFVPDLFRPAAQGECAASAAGVFVSATGFFVIVDFALWAMGNMYPHTLAGLGACYIAALPFYGNDLVSTALMSAVFFGLPVVAAKLVETMHGARNQQTLQ